ncbi:hypothetical protein NQ317_011695 [Molorchus minor]|uniref:Protein arginine N-methyltransferase 5 n=1 Tax=Molorchus minor TaxID=1323400 RepID=A0ABQ9JSQ9_9CUCU|nr:hypothetical protein NQ317_011695 [Molorchus minor]
MVFAKCGTTSKMWDFLRDTYSSGVINKMEEEGGEQQRKRMSVGLYVSCPANIKGTIDSVLATDRVLKSTEWNRLVVGELTNSIDVDSEVEHINEFSKNLVLQELEFASHLSIPAILIQLTKPNNTQLAHLLNDKIVSNFSYSVWFNIPMVHPSRYSPIAETEYDTWDWWNNFRTYCNYDKRLGLVLDLPDIKHSVPSCELDRWIGRTSHRGFPKDSEEVPVVMVVGAGRGPLVQAVLNVSYTLNRRVKVYAVEKNPYAINTLIDRVNNEWNNKVTLINEDMRIYKPPEMADILVSELLGSFGDNELSPECLDGAQRFLKRLIAPPQELFTFTHPNWSENINNRRFKKLKFNCSQTSVLTGFVGFFDTVLYKDVNLSIHPDTHTPDMVSWFPIVFPLSEPVHVTKGNVIEMSFWREESQDKVWYEWCLESPVKGAIMNPNGRSYFIRKR